MNKHKDTFVLKKIKDRKEGKIPKEASDNSDFSSQKLSDSDSNILPEDSNIEEEEEGF